MRRKKSEHFKYFLNNDHFTQMYNIQELLTKEYEVRRLFRKFNSRSIEYETFVDRHKTIITTKD